MKYFHSNIDISNHDEIIGTLLLHSNLPGPRGNLELIEEFATVFSNLQQDDAHFEFLFKLWKTPSTGDDAETILVLSGLWGFGYFAINNQYRSRVYPVFQCAMNDPRWRVREIIQESLKIVARHDYNQFVSLYASYDHPTLLELRAFLSTAAHPEILKESHQHNFAIHLLKQSFDRYLIVSQQLTKKDLAFDAYQKGLMFAPSVIVAACPALGFQVLNSYANKSPLLNKVLISNLKKNRLIKKYGDTCESCLSILQ
ncbi:hypothetical protein AOC36_10610 [Erysipelothrix larvae]|uniref:Uncharacterized protein n=1 Tax=Erysipelothrix larvae TaxID=1514105 RepID=A0A0X8H1M2_9FIRM|nr:hypothetical protein [Erysipelothrix larvae]AMC94406.1 hypothetical protein AOC36_10610 [Erysipelothrix larvae]